MAKTPSPQCRGLGLILVRELALTCPNQDPGQPNKQKLNFHHSFKIQINNFLFVKNLKRS